MSNEFPYRIIFAASDGLVECGTKDAESAFKVFTSLVGRGYPVAVFHGAMNVSDKFVVQTFTEKGD